jgi:hypothetical protein
MKKLFLLGIIALTMIGFTSCDKLSEDVYNSKCKIASITYDIADLQGSNATYIYEGKDVKTIQYQNGTYLELDYNNDRTVNKIIEYNADNTPTGVIMEMVYDNKKIIEMSYYDNGTLTQKYTFKRNNNVISNINILIDMELLMGEYMKNKEGIYNLAFNSEIPWEQISKIVEKSDIKGQMIELPGVTQFTDGNLTSFNIEIPMVASIQMNYTYDNCNNPFYGLNFVAAQFNCFNRNNATSTTIEMKSAILEMDMNINTTMEYTYNNKNYPLTLKQTTINMMEPEYSEDITQTFTYIK